MGLSLFLFLFGTIWTTTHAGDPDVFPSEFIVPQCTELEAVWSQPPPIHLHVQPGTSITVQNLVDLGLQTGTSTTFRPPFDIGTNFTFAYNTIANQFLVFQSSLMQVGPGTTDCLPGSENPPPPPPPPSSSASPAKNTDTVTVTTTTSRRESAAADPTPSRSSSNPVSALGSSTSAQESSATSSLSLPITTSSSPSSAADFTVVPVGTSKVAAFPVGPVVGSICALAVIILLGLALCWHWQRRSVRRLAALNSERAGADVEVNSSNFDQGPDMAEQAQLMPLTPNRYGAAPQEHPNMLRDRLMQNPSPSPTSTPSTVQDTEETNTEVYDELPPAYDHARRPSRRTEQRREGTGGGEKYGQSVTVFSAALRRSIQ